MGHMNNQPCSRGPNWMPHSNTATIDIDAVHVHPKILNGLGNNCSECFINLNNIEIINRPP